MSGTTPFVGYGMQLYFVDSTGAQHELAGLQQVSFGSDKVDTVDVTDTDATSGNKEFIPGMQDQGDCSVSANYLPGDTTQLALRTTKDALVATTFAFVQPAAVGGSRTFTGIITSVDVTLPLEKEAKLTAKIKITGAVSYS
jgi:predicted secreted protein